jgi:hypothetical protein
MVSVDLCRNKKTINKREKTMEKIYKEIKKDGKIFIVFDKLQAIANIYEYNKKLGAKY